MFVPMDSENGTSVSSINISKSKKQSKKKKKKNNDDIITESLGNISTGQLMTGEKLNRLLRIHSVQNEVTCEPYQKIRMIHVFWVNFSLKLLHLFYAYLFRLVSCKPVGYSASDPTRTWVPGAKTNSVRVRVRLYTRTRTGNQ